jgi:acyl-CoA-dependent ceramide synthase
VAPYFGVARGQENPFAKFFLLDGRVPSSPSDDPLFRKTYWDFAFIAYYVVFFSFVRQCITVNISTPVARYFGLRKEAKIDRFGEQNYAFWYFMVSGASGVVSQAFLPKSTTTF